MNKVLKVNNLSFYNDQGILILSAKQYDIGRKFIFNIIDNDEPFNLDGCTVYLRMLKADNTQFQGEECCSIDGSKIIVDTSIGNGEQILSCAGMNTCELHLTDSEGKSLTTWNFIINVESRVHNGDGIESIDSWDAWDKMKEIVLQLNIVLDEHTNNKENPHEVNKEQLGLSNVENKSSSTIRSEITKENVTTALGYTPYTPTEIDNKFSAFETGIDWKEAVETYDDIATAYPEPVDGWTVNVNDTDYTYRYNGTEWIAISANAIPIATEEVNGLLSKEDKKILDEAYNLTQKNELLNNKFITMENINNFYSDVKEKLLSFAYGFILSDGTNTTNLYENIDNGIVCAIDTVSLYGAITNEKYCTDYIYYNSTDSSYKLVSQVNQTDLVHLGYISETNITIEDSLIDKILLPFKLSEVLNLINNENDSIYSISYTDCGAFLDGIYDDRPFVSCAHRIANEYNLNVIQHFGTVYIANSGYIVVNADMDLNGSTILIDNYNRQGIFWLPSTEWAVPTDIDYTELTSDCSYCTAINSDYSDEESFYPNYTALKLTTPDACIRVDSGEQSNIDREELILMTYKGNIIYPPIDDATETTTYKAYIYPNKKTTIIGCTLNVNVSFAGSPIYFMRIEKSNVEIRDFYILPQGSTVKNTGYRGSVFTVKNAFDVTFDNISGFNIAGQPTDTLPNGTSGYVFDIATSLCVAIKNCNVTGYWGCMGMTGVKNIVINNSTLNRIDVHDYFKDLKVSNCTILDNGIQVGYGHGQVAITNCTLYTSKSYFVELRTDYGNMFDGIITMVNNHIKYTGSNTFNVIDNSTNFVSEALVLNENTRLQKPVMSVIEVSLEPVCDYNVSNFVDSEDVVYEDNTTIERIECYATKEELSSYQTSNVIVTKLTNEDLNTLKTGGRQYYSDGINTCTNKPDGVDAFALNVYQSAAGWYTQELFASNNKEVVYIRYYNSSAWTAWKQLAYINSNVASATKATQDANGNNIADTYATKQALADNFNNPNKWGNDIFGDDVNNWIEPGIYGSIGGTKNLPDISDGWATVLVLAANNANERLTQICWNWNNAPKTSYKRISNDAGLNWSNWVAIIDSDNYSTHIKSVDSVVDYNDSTNPIQIGWRGAGLTGDNFKGFAGYTCDENSNNVKIKDIDIQTVLSLLGIHCDLYTGDLNDIVAERFNIFNTNVGPDKNSPTGNWGFVITLRHVYTNTYRTQLFIGMTTHDLYYRIYINSTWNDWIKIPFASEVPAGGGIEFQIVNGELQYRYDTEVWG